MRVRERERGSEEERRRKSVMARASSSRDALDDTRFSSAKFDPRFARFPGGKGKGKRDRKEEKSTKDDGGKWKKKKQKRIDGDDDVNDDNDGGAGVSDPRFAEILKRDKRFAVGNKNLKIDKRGRDKTKFLEKKKKEKDEIDASSDDDDGDESETSRSESGSSDDGSDSDSGSSSFEDVLEGSEFKKKRLQAVEAFGIGAFAGRYFEDDELEEDDLKGHAEYQKLAQGERCVLDEATARVAVVDLDWENFTATDILAVFRSFVPQGHSVGDAVKRVTVYKSDYGIERMKVEDRQGPGIFFKAEKKKKKSEESDDSSYSDDGGSSESESDGEEIDKDALRAYERSKLRYFFAIAEFSDKKIAKYIYDTCDGLEFDRSSSRFDLRFVNADDKVEEGRPVKDEAKDVPLGYNAPLDGQSFYNSAIQHTNVNLTWDQEDKRRQNTFKQQFQKFKNKDAVMDADIAAYLASDSSSGEESESEETRKQRFRSMMNLGEDGGRSKGRTGKAFASRDWTAEEDKNVDMVVTFDSGIDMLGEKLKTKHERIKSGKGEPTVWENVLEQKKMKKKQKREEEQNEEEEVSNAGFDDPFFNEVDDKVLDRIDEPAQLEMDTNPKKKTKKKKEKGVSSDERKKEQAELDLLLTSDVHLQALSSGGKALAVKDDSDDDDEYKQRKKAKVKKGKKKKDKKEKQSKQFEMNLEDPRFSQMFSSREFALDPTEPQYKQLPETLVKKFHSTKKVSRSKRLEDPLAKPAGGKHDLKSAVESLKRKMKARERS